MKIITSPVARFPGTVTISDPLTLPQAIAMEQAIQAMQDLGEGATIAQAHYTLLPGICKCVEAWNLEDAEKKTLLGDLSADTFPATPRKASAELLAWLVGAVTALYNDAEDVPNA